MPLASNILGILLALTSAGVWGGGDFAGGYAARKSNQYIVLVVSALSGLGIVILAALVSREPLPSGRGILWATLGGISGALGIATFYRALSMGHTASVAPLAAVIGAALPIGVNVFFADWPSPFQWLGFVLALTGIWFISTGPATGNRLSREGLALACLGGLGFGGFLVCLGLVEQGKVFTPLIFSRCMTLCVGLVMIGLQRLRLPSLTSNRWALMAGVLDAGGNLFYVLAKQYTRMDVAAVLSSFYPVSTIFLAGLLLKEKVSRFQWIGVAICLCAIALITV